MKTNKRRAYTILIFFWILVGITSGAMYDLEWFIQHVVILNANISKNIADSSSPLFSIETVEEFYEIFYDKTHVLNSVVSDFYHVEIANAFRVEGLLFAVGALGAAFVTGPIVSYAIQKKQNYKLFILPALLMAAILFSAIVPYLSTVLLLWAFLTPVIALSYSYRSALDPWASTVAKRADIKISFVRTFYEVGAGIVGLIITQIYFHMDFYQRTSGPESSIAIYLLSGFLILLAVYIAIFMPNKVFDKEEEIVSNDKLTLKDVFFKRKMWIGLIIFFFLIGSVQAFNSVWVNTVENISTEYNDPSSVKYIGYMRVFSIVPMFIFAVLTLKLMRRYSFKVLLAIASIVASVTWILLGVFIYVLHINLYLVVLFGAIGQSAVSCMAILIGYEYVSKMTSPNTRNMTFVIFNGITYGVGGIVFTQINGFFSAFETFGHRGLIVWLIMGITSAMAFFIILIFFKNPTYDNNEINNEQFDELKVFNQK